MTTPATPQFPSRAQIRAIAEQLAAELAQARAEGRNPHQAALDLNERVAAFAESLGPEQGGAFADLLADELHAISAHAADQHSEELSREIQRRQWWWAVTVGVILGLPFLYRACA